MKVSIQRGYPKTFISQLGVKASSLFSQDNFFTKIHSILLEDQSKDVRGKQGMAEIEQWKTLKRQKQDTGTVSFLSISMKGQKCVEEHICFSVFFAIVVFYSFKPHQFPDSKPSRIKNQNGLSGAGHLLSYRVSQQTDLPMKQLARN